MQKFLFRLIAVFLAGLTLLVPSTAFAATTSFIAPLNISQIASTVPANGDINPYGVAVENGRETAPLTKFDDDEPVATIRRLGFAK